MTGQAGHRAAVDRMERARALTSHQIETVGWQIARAAQIAAEQAAAKRWHPGQNVSAWTHIQEPTYWTALAQIAQRRGNELRSLWRRLARQDAALAIYRHKHRTRADRGRARVLMECRT
jgi:hypothetical protein